MGLLEIYLIGWLLTSSVSAYQCEDGGRVITKGECRAISIAAGSLWPIIVPVGIYKKLK